MLRQFQVPCGEIEFLPKRRLILASGMLHSDTFQQFQRMPELPMAQAIAIFFFPYTRRLQVCGK
ncbi:hypothetical protein Q8A64_02590 [Oxalobacteraceae bacterium R-40]|uniref:Uncharacterized protein n=1 Tax=Keguizhuia sedimenti TaxID=3064264 RepID=A0ABU1BJY2_9BURK|nr:hypothetical protein [Oxalobacteraceae bacterium R-40]